MAFLRIPAEYTIVMASTFKASPLANLTRLTPTTLLYYPPQHNTTSPTVLLHTWMNASQAHIQFYFQKWAALMPTARIIVILGTVPNMVYTPISTQKRNLGSAISALRAEPDSPIYMHLFSNSGAQSASVLLRAFKGTSSAESEEILPVKGILFDSTPSRGTYKSAYTGISFQIPRSPLFVYILGLAFIHALVSLMWIVERVSGNMNVLSQSNSDLVDSRLVPRGIPRAYFYSREDRLVRWQDIEHHAAVAESKGWDVKTERFVKTGHCRHGKGEGEEKYWAAVKDVVNASNAPAGGNRNAKL